MRPSLKELDFAEYQCSLLAWSGAGVGLLQGFLFCKIKRVKTTRNGPKLSISTTAHSRMVLLAALV